MFKVKKTNSRTMMKKTEHGKNTEQAGRVLVNSTNSIKHHQIKVASRPDTSSDTNLAENMRSRTHETPSDNFQVRQQKETSMQELLSFVEKSFKIQQQLEQYPLEEHELIHICSKLILKMNLHIIVETAQVQAEFCQLISHQYRKKICLHRYQECENRISSLISNRMRKLTELMK